MAAGGLRLNDATKCHKHHERRLRRAKIGGRRHLLKPESSPSAPARVRCGARGLLPGEAPCPGYVTSTPLPPLGSTPSCAPAWPNFVSSGINCS